MEIDSRIIEAQRQAAHPLNSVWVSASAGSGKTKVLTDRVLNLLLSDTRPEKILCLTFTKAAAAEMSNRITDKLKKWTIAPFDDLCKELTELLGVPPSNETILKARKLFVEVLEAPGGMKIMTIHSFCQSVLGRFPIEAKIPPQFDVIDEAKSSLLMKQVVDETFLNPAFECEIDALNGYFQERDIQIIFNNILKNEARFADLFQQIGSYETIKKQLKKKYNLSKYQSENDILIDFLNPLKFLNYTQEDVREAQQIFEERKANHLTKNLSKVKTKKLIGTVEEAEETFLILEQLNMFRIIELTGSILHLIEQIVHRYRLLKQEESLMDYGDLIYHTKKLLTQSGMSQWVMFKMDEGIDHILVDEAQDTNPEQWEIIRLISEEFFAGFGRETSVVRTIFAVGDKKQSIYSFQGADPSEFERMHFYFKKKVLDSKHQFQTVPLNASFRSTQTVLDLVNDVLHFPVAAKGVLNVGENADHTAVRKKEAGLIEIWPLVEVEKEENDLIWPLPKRQKNENPISVLSVKIAKKIKDFLDNKEILKSENRPIEPKDILILVSKRSGIVTELVRALKEKNVPVAGIDRLDLGSHIAVQDLLSAARFALLPEDDLNLATLLKSPLCGISETELMNCCIHREKLSLWSIVQKRLPDIAEKLQKIQNLADKMPVYEFFSYILSPMHGRKAFIRRLGLEANEAIDEFLSLTLQYEQSETPSLQNFIIWFQNRNNIIKRDMDQSQLNAVKIMTIHGSKGLQGNIVFMPDAQRIPSLSENFFWTEENLPLWIARSEFKNSFLNPLYEQYRNLTEEEYHRLLYVALTRARDRLYICGWAKPKKKSDEKKSETQTKPNNETALLNWYDLIQQALPEKVKTDASGYIHIESEQEKIPDKKQKDGPIYLQLPFPTCLNHSAPMETPLSKPLMPSRLVENEPQTESLGTGNQDSALKRGIFIHKLLQYLPEIEPSKRKEIAFRLKPDEIDISEKLFDVFEDPTFNVLFGQNSVAEAPITGIVSGKVFSGQIDRLIVLDNEVWIVDYKSNRYVPKSPNEVHKTYKAQLYAYNNLIKDIFPDKIIRTFLLWCENLTLMEMTETLTTFTPEFVKDKK